jgi:hypothetical protein
MGRFQAEAMAAEDFIPLEGQLRWHLTANHYPPVPVEMVPICIEAIDEANEGNWDKMIKLPEGISWRGEAMSPVYAIVEAHHLDTWIIESELD